MKACPLCHRSLAADGVCATRTTDHLYGGTRSHYSVSGDDFVYMFVGKYYLTQMNEYSQLLGHRGDFSIYKLIVHDPKHNDMFAEDDIPAHYKLVTTVPDFEIKSETDVLRKLDIWTLFS